MNKTTGQFLWILTISFWFLWGAGLPLISASQEADQYGRQVDDRGPATSGIEVSEGTVIPIVMGTFFNTRSSHVGDTFYADTAYPVWVRQRLVIPAGSIVKGTVTHIKRPGKIKGRGQLSIRFDSVLLVNGVERKLVAALQGIHGPGLEKLNRQTETVEMDSTVGKDVGVVVGTTASGAVIGAIAGNGTGAGIGAGAGAAFGLLTTLFSRGRELILEPGTQFDLVLKRPLRFANGELPLEGNPQGRRAPSRSRPRRPETRNHGSGPFSIPGIGGLPVP